MRKYYNGVVFPTKSHSSYFIIPKKSDSKVNFENDAAKYSNF